MRNLIQKIVKLRNPHFSFDDSLNSAAIIQFIYIQAWCLARGLRMLLYFKNPKGMLLGTGVRFFNISKIQWGKFLKLGAHVYVSALAKEGITFGNHVGIGAFSRIIVSTSLNDIGKFIRIGSNVGIGEYAYLGGAGGLAIGDDTIVGQYFSCHPENHQYGEVESLIRNQGVTRKGIQIGRNCWIGSKVTILDGVTIGDGCVVAAGAVVTQSFPGNCILGGVPAKLIRERNA
jgi:acetyltransferase-like isoleucine patch superfamily enzyme